MIPGLEDRGRVLFPKMCDDEKIMPGYFDAPGATLCPLQRGLAAQLVPATIVVCTIERRGQQLECAFQACVLSTTAGGESRKADARLADTASDWGYAHIFVRATLTLWLLLIMAATTPVNALPQDRIVICRLWLHLISGDCCSHLVKLACSRAYSLAHRQTNPHTRVLRFSAFLALSSSASNEMLDIYNDTVRR